MGDRLVGNEGHGDTVIEICYIGERKILAHTISHKGQVFNDYMHREENWTLELRDWEPTA